MSNIIDMQQFLVGKTFCIPSFQRDYAWTTEQVDDLFGDVQEALDVGSSHYLGTFVLADRADQGYDIGDGQQRLTTVTLMIQALLEELAPTDRDRIADEMILLRQGQALKVDFGKNAAFIAALFAERDPTPGSAGQRKLKAAYAFAHERARALSRDGGSALVKRWLITTRQL